MDQELKMMLEKIIEELRKMNSILEEINRETLAR